MTVAPRARAAASTAAQSTTPVPSALCGSSALGGPVVVVQVHVLQACLRVAQEVLEVAGDGGVAGVEGEAELAEVEVAGRREVRVVRAPSMFSTTTGTPSLALQARQARRASAPVRRARPGRARAGPHVVGVHDVAQRARPRPPPPGGGGARRSSSAARRSSRLPGSSPLYGPMDRESQAGARAAWRLPVDQQAVACLRVDLGQRRQRSAMRSSAAPRAGRSQESVGMPMSGGSSMQVQSTARRAATVQSARGRARAEAR